MTILGVIPARGGSKGLRRKNIVPLAGRSLVRRAIESARESKMLTAFVVSTEDLGIGMEAREQDTIIVDRPPELATDEAGMLPVLQHAVRAVGGPRPDLIVCLQPTSPFRTGALIDRVIQKVIDTGADSAQTLTESPESPLFMSQIVDGDRIKPFSAHDHIVRRQDAPPAYIPTGAVYVTRYDVLMRQGLIRGADNRAVVCGFEESANIDTIWDFRLAEIIAEERGW